MDRGDTPERGARDGRKIGSRPRDSLVLSIAVGGCYFFGVRKAGLWGCWSPAVREFGGESDRISCIA